MGTTTASGHKLGQKPQTLAHRVARILTHIALACWIISLLLPGFRVYSLMNAMYGVPILILGFMFGWAVSGWAVYANLFFPYVIVRLYLGKASPIAVILMIVIAATIVTFKGVVRDEGSGAILPVVSWGTGAIVWCVSLLLAASASMIYSRILGPRSACVVVCCIGLVVAWLGVKHFTQRAVANAQERHIFLSDGMVFTVTPLCGISFNWPDSPVIPHGAMVKLDIDDSLRSPPPGLPYLLLPRFVNYQEGGFHWRIYRDVNGAPARLKVRSPAVPARYVLEARRRDRGAVLRLVDTQSHNVVYEQQLRVTNVSRYHSYCPYSSRDWRRLDRGYDTAVLRAVAQEYHGPDLQRRLTPQVARTPCTPGPAGLDGVRDLRAWDGRQVILRPDVRKLTVGFCSKEYIGLVSLYQRSADPADVGPGVELFDRKSMKPIAMFRDKRQCPRKVHCKAQPASTVKGLRIEQDAVVVETKNKNLRAFRITY